MLLSAAELYIKRMPCGHNAVFLYFHLIFFVLPNYWCIKLYIIAPAVAAATSAESIAAQGLGYIDARAAAAVNVQNGAFRSV